MDDIRVQSASADLGIEGLTEKESIEFQKILSRFVKSYSAKAPDVDLKDWLFAQFKEELPNLSDEDCERLSQETLDSIEEFDDNLKSVNEAASKGISKENWFADRVAAASVGVSVVEYGNYIRHIDNTIGMANSQMMRAVLRKDGGIRQDLNLDGFIAEQAHVNKFNMEAVLQNSPYRAEVCVPESTYAQNSFDAVIRDITTKNKEIVHQYQFKFGSTAQDTIRMIKDGNYNNQRIVVPIEQVAEVQKVLPGKSVEAYIGGTDKVSIMSEGISKRQVKEMQLNVQDKSIIPRSDWNAYNTKALALNLGKQAGFIGLQAAAITVGFDLAAQAMSGEPIEGEEVIKLALESGADAGVKAAVTGAMKVGAEKGILSVIPQGTPVGVIANLACVTVENVKILWKLAKGEITAYEAIDMMGKNTVAMSYGLGWGSVGAAVGASALSWIPIVGPIVGGLVGGMLGYMAGSKFGEAIYNGAKKIVGTAKKIVKTAWEGVKSVTTKTWDKITSIFS